MYRIVGISVSLAQHTFFLQTHVLLRELNSVSWLSESETSPPIIYHQQVVLVLSSGPVVFLRWHWDVQRHHLHHHLLTTTKRQKCEFLTFSEVSFHNIWWIGSESWLSCHHDDYVFKKKNLGLIIFIVHHKNTWKRVGKETSV